MFSPSNFDEWEVRLNGGSVVFFMLKGGIFQLFLRADSLDILLEILSEMRDFML